MKSFTRSLGRTVPAQRARMSTSEDVRFQNGTKMNLVSAITSALDNAMLKDRKVCLFGEDVAFGGVFRASNGLLEKYGKDRVFNTPLAEQGIAGFAIGLSGAGYKAVAEIQFADYFFPAIDQLINEASKYRYRSGGLFEVGGLTMRAPCGAVGHGGHYHSMSIEAYLAHIPGVITVMPSTPSEAKGLLIACIENPNPTVFLEPKILYRSAQEQVNPDYYTLPIGKARVVREGADVTLVGWGAQVHVLTKAAARAEEELGVKCEVIDLRTLVPWDKECVEASVKKTGRLIVSHEENITGGFGAEICAAILDSCFLHLESPPKRVCGYDTPFPLVLEQYYLPGVPKVFEAIRESVRF